MKIHNDSANVPLPVSGDTAAAKASRADRASQNTDQPRAEADAVTTSEIARHLETDPAREARIERLREQVQNGTYSVPANQIAGRLIDAHLTDLTKRS